MLSFLTPAHGRVVQKVSKYKHLDNLIIPSFCNKILTDVINDLIW